MSTAPYVQLEAIFKRYSIAQSVINILHWDAAVVMPKGGGSLRGEQLSLLESLCHQLLTNPQLSDYFENVNVNELDAWQQANVKEMQRHWQRAKAIPALLVEKLTLATTEAELAWRQARQENNFKIFAPHLQEVVSLTQEKAEYLAQALNKSPYDALLAEYDPDRTSAEIDSLFSDLRLRLPTLIDKIIESQQPYKPLHSQPIAVSKQKHLSETVMRALGFSFENGRLDVSAHPFSSGIGTDIRITSRFDENDLVKGLAAVLHETGHAMYDFALPQNWLWQPVGYARSLMVHESQSLFLEFNIGRSRAFCQFLQPLLKDYSVNTLYQSFNHVSRSLIRVDADEATYALHILLRYELEKQIFSNQLSMSDLPLAWNETMKKYLSITPSTDSEGCLQDIHWSMGNFGYFPVYALGAIMAAQLFLNVKPEVMSAMSEGKFELLWNWLHESVHQQGSRYTSNELLVHTTKQPLNSQFYLDYLTKKYLPN